MANHTRASARTTRAAVAVAIVAAAAVLAPRVARAQEPARVSLALVREDGAEACPDGPAVAREVRVRLGRDPFDPGATRSIDVAIRREGSAWTARIFVRDTPTAPPAMRVLSSAAPTCERLAASLELAIALTIDPDAPRTPAPPAGPPARPAAPPASPRTLPAPAAVPPPSAPPPPTVRDPWDVSERLVLRAAVVLGPLPAPSPALQLGMDTRRRGPFRASFGALRTLEARTADGAFLFGLTAFQASACLGVARGRVAGDACAGVQFGVTHAVVQDTARFEPLRVGDHPWVVLSLAFRGSLHLVDPLALEVGVEPTVALLRQRFRLAGATEPVFEQSVLGLAGYFGLRVRFW